MAVSENHINNYYLLRQAVKYINDHAQGQRLSECLSLNKKEFLLLFGEGEQRFALKAFLSEDSSIFFPENVKLPRDVKRLFPSLEGLKLLDCIIHRQDRSFRLIFEKKMSLVFQLYGRNGNVLLFEGDNVAGLFRTGIQNDLSRKLADYTSGPDPDPDEVTVSNRKELSGSYPSFTKSFFQQLEIENWPEWSTDRQKARLKTLLNYLEDPHYYLSETDTGMPLLGLFKSEGAEEFDHVAGALNEYAARYFYRLHFNQLRQRNLQRVQAALKKAEEGLASANRSLAELEKDKNYKIQADLLMANLHGIPKGAVEVKLPNFYTGEETLIKLKQGYTPQKWAEKLYQKAKKQDIERERALSRAIALEEEIAFLGAEREELESISSIKELRDRTKQQDKETAAEKALPFKKFSYGGYDIYVGKTAENNDRLSFGFAHKEDMWLHAKDVSGSHVVIRHKKKGEFPMPVLERAAEIAAWYSKGKSSGLCPVLYTLKKYVRKPKGAAPGAVLCEKEKVILVEPKLQLS